MHLWFLVHGLFGKHSHLRTTQDALEAQVPDSDMVYSARSNELFWTFNGIQVGAYRLYTELMKVITESETPITQISIIGYSLGGLYTRYLIGLLESSKFFDSVEPLVYATFATPHLGTPQWSGPLNGAVLNGLGTFFLGLSGAQLVNSWGYGVVQSLAEPDSVYICGLNRFRRRMLFANAVNDRTVHFWTAYITNKVPFSKQHKQIPKLVFHSFNGDPEGEVFLDMQRSRHTAASPSTEKTSRPLVLNLAFVIGPLILFFVALGAWISTPPAYVKWLTLYYYTKRQRAWENQGAHSKGRARHPKKEAELEGTDGTTDLESIAQKALDELPPKDVETQSSSAPEVEGPLSSYPQPVVNNQAAFIDATTETLPFGGALMRRMNNLNTVAWEKYTVYIEGWSHARIINRHHSEDCIGNEIAKFFVVEALKTTT